MDAFPHHYQVSIGSEPDATDVVVTAAGLPDLTTNAPREYDGPGDRWSPETLLMAAVADCFVLSFRAIAQASSLDWQALQCDVSGTLDKVERAVRFTEIALQARVSVASDAEARAQRILQKAKDTCLITNSLSARIDFRGEVQTAA